MKRCGVRSAECGVRVVAALAAVLLAPRAALAQGKGPFEGKVKVVQDVDFEGLKRNSRQAVLDKIDTKPGVRFSEETLSRDLEKLQRWGEFESPAPGVPPVEVRVTEVPGGGVRVVFVVHERPRVRQVKFSGADPLKRSEIDEFVQTKKDGLYDQFRVAVDARALRDKLVEKGYLFVSVEAVPHRTAGGVEVEFVIHPGPKVHVEEIVFESGATDKKLQLDPEVVKKAEGANALETKERKLFGLLEAGTFDRRALRRDLDRVVRYYRSQGFLDAKVYLERYEFNDDKTALTIHIRIEEGERYTVRSVQVEGIRVLDEKRVIEELRTRPGRPFLGDDLRTDIDRIKRLYADRAYIHADVDVDVKYDVDRKLLDVTYRVSEGPQVRIDRIRIEGNDRTKEKVIRRELSFFPGEYFDATKVEQSIQRLGRLRYFKDVRIDFEPGSEPGKEDVVLKVEEARTGSFVIGGGISTNAGVFGNIALTQRNFDITNPPTSWRDLIDGRAFAGGGQQFSIQLQPGKDRSQYRISFVEPYLLDFPVILGIDGFIFDRQREDWLESRIGTQEAVGYRLLPDLIAKTTYRFERVRVGDVRLGAVPDVLEVAGNNYVSAIRFSLTYDQNVVDRTFVLYGGYSATIGYELAGGILGGDVSFSKLTLEANWQHSFIEWPGDHKWVLQLNSEVGWMDPFGSSRHTPIFERFFAGGPHSIRGFEFRGVGPKFDGKPVGGDFLALAGAEFSFPLFMHYLRGVAFIDSGILERRIRDSRWADYRVSAGFGFRITLPVFPAPVAIDFGWPLRKTSLDDKQVFSFSVGFGF